MGLSLSYLLLVFKLREEIYGTSLWFLPLPGRGSGPQPFLRGTPACLIVLAVRMDYCRICLLKRSFFIKENVIQFRCIWVFSVLCKLTLISYFFFSGHFCRWRTGMIWNTNHSSTSLLSPQLEVTILSTGHREPPQFLAGFQWSLPDARVG